MKKLLVLLILLALILAVGDRLAEAYTENQIDASMEAGLAQVGGVESDIASFPFLGRIAFGGEVQHATITLTDLVQADVPIAELRLQVDGLRFDRGSVVHSNRLRITGVDRVAVRVVVTEEDLRTVLGDAVDQGFAALQGAELTVTPEGVTVAGVHIPLPLGDLLPCDAAATVTASEIELACEADRLPALIVDAIGSVDLRDQLGV